MISISILLDKAATILKADMNPTRNNGTAPLVPASELASPAAAATPSPPAPVDEIDEIKF